MNRNFNLWILCSKTVLFHFKWGAWWPDWRTLKNYWCNTFKYILPTRNSKKSEFLWVAFAQYVKSLTSFTILLLQLCSVFLPPLITPLSSLYNPAVNSRVIRVRGTLYTAGQYLWLFVFAWSWSEKWGLYEDWHSIRSSLGHRVIGHLWVIGS